MTTDYELVHGVRLHLAVDGHDDPTGQALKDMDLANQREEAAEGGGCFPWESAVLKKAREALAEAERRVVCHRRVICSMGRALERARKLRVGELLFANKTLDQAEADKNIVAMDEAIARGKGAIS